LPHNPLLFWKVGQLKIKSGTILFYFLSQPCGASRANFSAIPIAMRSSSADFV